MQHTQSRAIRSAESVEKRIEAEFYAGWIALRYLKHPATAARHFADAAKLAVKPISVARARYWQGRAAEALGADGEARGLLRRGRRLFHHLLWSVGPDQTRSA